MNTSTTLHPFFETLGAGPYCFLYCYDLGEAMNPDSAANFGNMRGWAQDAPKLKAGLGTCAHCGMAISIICVVRTGNGDLYGVGSDCVEKCDHHGSFNGAKAAIALRNSQRRKVREAAKRAAKWEAERPEREARIQEQQAAMKAEFEKRHAAIISNFTRHLGIVEWLTSPTMAQGWMDQYKARHRGYCGQIYAEFSPPCDVSSFYQSLAIQLIQSGSLSPRQADCVARAMYGRAKKHEDTREKLINELTGRSD